MWMMVFYVGILIGLFIIKLKNPHSLYLKYYRVFLPSWKFFDLPGDQFRLYVYSERQKYWHPISLNLTQKMSSFFMNAKGNECLARRSLIEEFLIEVQNLTSNDEIEKLSTFCRVKKLAFDELSQLESNFVRFQFKIVVNREDAVHSNWLSN